MTKDEIKRQASLGVSEDIDGSFYTIYDFDTIYNLITNEFKNKIAILPPEISKFVDDNFWDLV